MIIQDSKYADCKTCGTRKLIQDRKYGCDNCRKEMDFDEDHLRLDVFHPQKETDNYQFCSWKCVFTTLRKIKIDDFVSLPLLSKNRVSGKDVRAFWKELKK